MRDVNYKIREAYYNLLTPVLSYQGEPVKVYNTSVKLGDMPDIYVYITTQSVRESSPKSATAIQANININIIAKTIHNSNREAVDFLADQIYSVVYPYRDFTISIAGLSIVDNTVDNDMTMDLGNDGTRQYLSRIITFNHRIFLS